jgi:hypothetical protein
VFDYSVYFCVLILESYSRYFDPINNNHPAVKTSYSRQHHLSLSIGSEIPITIIDIVGYSEPISPFGLSRQRVLIGINNMIFNVPPPALLLYMKISIPNRQS